jgi:hypothetical protein
MAKYVIVEESWEYNDEWYVQPESEGYNIKSKLYSEENLNEAQAEVDRLNEECKEDEYYTDDIDNPIQPYKIVKIEE